MQEVAIIAVGQPDIILKVDEVRVTGLIYRDEFVSNDCFVAPRQVLWVSEVLVGADLRALGRKDLPCEAIEQSDFCRARGIGDDNDIQRCDWEFRQGSQGFGKKGQPPRPEVKRNAAQNT